MKLSGMWLRLPRPFPGIASGKGFLEYEDCTLCTRHLIYIPVSSSADSKRFCANQCRWLGAASLLSWCSGRTLYCRLDCRSAHATVQTALRVTRTWSIERWANLVLLSNVVSDFFRVIFYVTCPLYLACVCTWSYYYLSCNVQIRRPFGTAVELLAPLLLVVVLIILGYVMTIILYW